jgi:hypothetical protein
MSKLRADVGSTRQCWSKIALRRMMMMDDSSFCYLVILVSC